MLQHQQQHQLQQQQMQQQQVQQQQQLASKVHPSLMVALGGPIIGNNPNGAAAGTAAAGVALPGSDDGAGPGGAALTAPGNMDGLGLLECSQEVKV